GAVGPAPLGGGVVGGGGLNPITTETVMETPATLQTRYLAQLFEQGQPGQRSVEGLVASKLISGQDPSLIMTDLQAKLANPQASGLDANEAALFKNSLPQKDVLDGVGNPTGETTIDWNATRKWIEDKAAPFQQEQAQLLGPNITQNAYGQYVSLSEQPSEMMQYLQKLGLPDPRSQYGIDFSVQSDPQLAELMTSIGTKGQAFDEARKTYEKYLKDKPIAQSLARRAEGLKGGREDQYRRDMAAYMRDLTSQATKPADVAPRREAQEAGPPGWLGDIGGAIGGAFSGLPGQINDTVARIAGRPVAPPGAPTTPTNVALFPEPGRPTPTPPPTMRGPGLLEQMYARMNQPDRQYALAGQMNQASRSQGEDMLAMVRAIAPGYGAMRAGRSPFKDAIMQRLQPILAAGGARR
ncbi:MAG TPA: hypothetical protein VJY85_12060, partial [Candidatus Limnocylindria bacterium]|nr:hypothetical protein [Candidatus Limnocylindria bacterium]